LAEYRETAAEAQSRRATAEHDPRDVTVRDDVAVAQHAGWLMMLLRWNIARAYDRRDVVQRERSAMPLFMDVHTLAGGVSAGDVAEAHAKDVETQAKYGVDYKSYWVDESAGKIFCLVEAPDAEAAHRVHREAHGLVADEIYEVHQGT
jgi:hypothetical protein